jgi:hypothetical protein
MFCSILFISFTFCTIYALDKEIHLLTGLSITKFNSYTSTGTNIQFGVPTGIDFLIKHHHFILIFSEQYIQKKAGKKIHHTAITQDNSIDEDLGTTEYIEKNHFFSTALLPGFEYTANRFFRLQLYSGLKYDFCFSVQTKQFSSWNKHTPLQHSQLAFKTGIKTIILKDPINLIMNIALDQDLTHEPNYLKSKYYTLYSFQLGVGYVFKPQS